MGQPRGFLLPLLFIALAAPLGGCSSGTDRTSAGSFTVRFGATGAVAGAKDGSTSGVVAASLALSGLEARREEGIWVPVEDGLPLDLGLNPSADAGGIVTLPSGLLPDGHYTALQIRISKVEPTLRNGAHAAIAPPRAGWSLIIPVDFVVATGQSTAVDLALRLDASFRLTDGALEFEPDIDVEGVEHG